MTCIKTGADVWIEQHSCLVHGDLFEVGDCYILNCGAGWEHCTSWHIVLGAPGYLSHLTMYAFENCGERVLVAQKAHCNDFSYNGWTK